MSTPVAQGPWAVPLFAVLGVFAGILSGLFGVGGGIVIVPLLMYGLGYSQLTASGTSLVALLLPVGIGGVLAYYQDGKIDGHDIRVGLYISLGMVGGSFLGARLAMMLAPAMLKRAFALLLLFLACRTWLSASS